MTKRRRERDRPKAAPDSTYDPNKRVLLSYDTDDEGETSLSGVAATRPDENNEHTERAGEKQLDDHQPTLNVAAGAAVDQPSEAAAGNEVAGEKLVDGGRSSEDKEPPETPNDLISGLDDDEDDEEYDPADAFQRSDANSSKTGQAERKANAYPSKNAVTNQKPALGSLLYQYENDEEDEGWESAEDEAMAYLRAVRTERQNMPVVLRAAAEDDEENVYEIGDSRGYIEDDCYIARPIIGPASPDVTAISAMQAYTDALKTRFLATRTHLNSMPQLAKDAPFDEKHPTPRPHGGNKAYAKCIRLVKDTTPTPRQIQAMDQTSVLGLLELIQKHYFQRGHLITRNTSAWIWALLARLEDVGMMNNDEVSVLRELGKRAVIIHISFNDAVTAAQLEGVGQEEVTCQMSEEDAATKQTNEQDAKKPSSEADNADSSNALTADKDNTLATLDMVLAIVGELFGQRDLLEFRRSWEPEAHVVAESEALYGS